MKQERKLTRFELAGKLQDLALRIAAGKTIRIGRKTVRIPDEVSFEMELEAEDGEQELELEIKWVRE